MTESSERVMIPGMDGQTNVLTLRPEPGVAVRGGWLFVHGHGEYARRYVELFADSVAAGWVVVIPDLPGHGLSDGKRGHLRSFGELAALFRWCEQTLADEVGGDERIVLGGHSMGGLVVAWLVATGVVRPAAVWMGSPLLDPSYNKPWALVAMARVLDVLCPRMVISNGVDESHCYALEVGDSPEMREDVDPDADKFEREEMVHRWISMRLGMELLRAADEVWRVVPAAWPKGVPLVFTQGAKDPVCPVEVARQFVDQMAAGGHVDVRFHEMEDALHEPHRDAHREQLLEAVRSVLEQWVPVTEANASEPSPST
ncbi:alpha/beta fold hydrolase [Sulfuriroseicoccus oceanibius]|uniref:Alpha/beta fold hydrolase n=1 Tax=Sulfuriroseicoccus oceanibius TaxID=2707525 RepID=A0A6B3L1F4_9BACT|nr:alpha/beta fold hydrolase [Sulfuriroseicoccus oceanibius]QQL46136.1 alpha/beta fold hydrolase [Sulfuriroseicoccus oceanibius]